MGTVIFIICIVIAVIALAYSIGNKWAQFNVDFEHLFTKIGMLKNLSEGNLRIHRDLLLNTMIKSQTSGNAACSEILSKVIKADEQCGNQVAAQCNEVTKLIAEMYVTHPTFVSFNQK